MKKLIVTSLTIFTCALVIALIPTEAEAAIYDDTVRLHIIANSDSEEDQSMKIAVRDALLFEYGEALSKAENAEDAAEKIAALLPKIEKSATETLEALGSSLPVKATVTKEYYETREYENFTLPAGEYTSLRVIIGSGGGKNWWCVMYPPLCLGASVADDGVINYTAEEVKLISGGGYKIKFKLLELISGL